ncbi:uncharacterized protein LOC143248537 isoform X1 [Tachypleus tridentatus]|uniref:uncharacterized protein LOC143248537 isoform X1 n=1 Tax=Tachypleus tridentatus TaxID=6853 RepID=UPI003FD11857
MKFHSVHGRNIEIEDGGTRAIRNASFCDAITFGNKPLSINSRISIQLHACEEWSGALRLGVTSHDPSSLASSMLPRFACQEFFSKEGFWARPVPEEWAVEGNRLTFYINNQGYFHLFVNNEHKGALLSGLPVKEQLWPILDLYGTTVSIRFIATESNPPEEVVARGPEALRAYERACSEGSVPLTQTRIFLIGALEGDKSLLKWKLVGKSVPEEEKERRFLGIDTTFTCQTVEENGKSWKIGSGTTEEGMTNTNVFSTRYEYDQVQEKYYQAIAENVVRELLLQRKKKQEEKKRTPFVRSALRLHSSLSKKSTFSRSSNKIENSGNTNLNKQTKRDSGDSKCSSWTDEIPQDIPDKVVTLVERLLKEADSKQDWNRKESEKPVTCYTDILFNVWNFSEDPFHLLPHQIFATSQAIYVYVLDLNQDLDEPIPNFSETNGSGMTPLSLLRSWLTALHLTVSQNNITCNYSGERHLPEEKDDIPALRPPVLIVGMLKKVDKTSEENYHIMVEERFARIRESLQDAPCKHHVVPTCFLLNWMDAEVLETQMENLRLRIRMIALSQPQMSMEVPLRWLAFHRAVLQLLEKKIYMAGYCQLYEIALREGIVEEDELWAMLHFLHEQGKLISFPSNLVDKTRDVWEGIAVLDPQWFIDQYYKLFDSSVLIPTSQQSSEPCNVEKRVDSQSEYNGVGYGYLSDEYFTSVWSDARDYKRTLIEILETLGLLCDPGKEQDHDSADDVLDSYWIPWVARIRTPYAPTLSDESHCLRLYLDFHGLLPVGFFSRLLTRLGNWSCRQRWRRLPQLVTNQARIAVDPEHDLLVENASFVHAEIMVVLTRVNQNGNFKSPSVQACEKVRHLLETELEALRNSWYKRLSYRLCVSCPCRKVCVQHGIPGCAGPSCVHLLLLSDCLAQKTVQCEYRIVETDFIRKHFPFSSLNDCGTSSYTDLHHLSFTNRLKKSCWEPYDPYMEEPSWVKVASSSLNHINAGNDWLVLAKRLGYNERETTIFQDEVNPSLAMIRDWLRSNGRTRHCVDLLVSCLGQMGREDICESIKSTLDPEFPGPPVFISYQWESQETVLELRRRLELAGYPCWMDVGQLGGGDSLYGKIYEGISGAKVVICCLTPRYAASPTCSREASLADVLRKPIIPVMMEPTPWPPPGPLAIVLSSLVYVDLCGIGGHGGSGRQADWEQRFNDIIERILYYVSCAVPQRASHTQAKLYSPPRATVASEFWTRSINTEGGPTSSEETSQRRSREDNSSVSSLNLRGNETREGNETPMAWRFPRGQNRVTQCLICVIL